MLNENNDIVFPYQVNTVMPITGLSCGNIMVPSTVKLTKEDVAICIKKAPVFRRFQNRKLERVTISSIDRLHNEEYMTEEEYEEYKDKLADNRGKVTDNIVKEDIVVEPIKEEVPVEEPKKEIPAVEPIVEEADTIKDEVNDQTEESIEETAEENINDEEISEDVTETESDNNSEETDKNEYNHNNRYNNKKKHNR